MNWNYIAQAISDAISVLLLVRIVALRLHIVYRLLCAFLFVQLLGSVIAFGEKMSQDQGHHWDYRLTWIPEQVVLWVLSLWIVYALLSGTLQALPGILRFSRKLLNITFAAALAFALWSARAEYPSSNAAAFATPLGKAVGVTLILNRAIYTAALIALLAILCFVLWFPVQMPKNLALFSVGFAIYFAATTVSLLAWSLWSRVTYRVADDLAMLVLSLCSLCWVFLITAEGESIPVRIGHSWHPAEQQKLIGRLEAMNANLLGATRR